jgi:hypothetical protein
VLAGVIQNHPNRAVPDLSRKLVRRLACHGSILSGVGASGKPGAVHLAPGSLRCSINPASDILVTIIRDTIRNFPLLE